MMELEPEILFRFDPSAAVRSTILGVASPQLALGLANSLGELTPQGQTGVGPTACKLTASRRAARFTSTVMLTMLVSIVVTARI